MKIGTCVRKDHSLFDAPKTGEYLEVAATAIYDYDEETFARVKQAVAEGTLTLYCANVLFPSTLRLTGPDVDFDGIRAYCQILFPRLAELGIKMIVFGSGKAKHVPDGFPMEEAWEQLFRLGHILADEAEKHGQTVVVEPLSYTEVNIVNTVGDAAYYAETVHRDSFKILVDFYHFSNNGEDLASLKKHANLLAHAHFASKVTRTPPRSEEDWAFFTECVRALKEIGYTGGLSFEGRVAETDDLAAILLRMREIERSV